MIRPFLTGIVLWSSLAAMLLILTMPSSASAAPYSPGDGVAALVSSAARHASTAGGAIEVVAARRISPHGAVAFAAGNRTELPDDPSVEIALGAIEGGPRLRLGLPRLSLSAGPSADSRSAAGRQAGAIAVQPLTDGSLRAAVVLTSAAAPKSYAFRLTLPRDVRALRNAAGGVDLVRRSPSRKVVGTLLVGRLEVPWAVDANGRAVRTWYTVDGNAIIQHIDIGPASAFPIVADPRIVWHWYGPGIKFNRRETRGARNRGAVFAMLAAMCAVLGPETLGIACGVGAAEAGGISAVASNAYGEQVS